MGFSIRGDVICYLVLHRSWARRTGNPELKPEQSIADWVRSIFPDVKLIEGVDEDSDIFDFELSDNGDHDETSEHDRDWVAIILSNISCESYKGRDSSDSDNFKIFKFARLYKHPSEIEVMQSVSINADW